MLSYHLLLTIDVGPRDAARLIQSVRTHHYELLRQVFPGTLSESTIDSEKLKAFVIPEGAYAANKRLQDLPVHMCGVKILAVGKGKNPHIKAEPNIVVSIGDVLVLYGTLEQIARAERILLQGNDH